MTLPRWLRFNILQWLASVLFILPFMAEGQPVGKFLRFTPFASRGYYPVTAINFSTRLPRYEPGIFLGVVASGRPQFISGLSCKFYTSGTHPALESFIQFKTGFTSQSRSVLDTSGSYHSSWDFFGSVSFGMNLKVTRNILLTLASGVSAGKYVVEGYSSAWEKPLYIDPEINTGIIFQLPFSRKITEQLVLHKERDSLSLHQFHMKEIRHEAAIYISRLDRFFLLPPLSLIKVNYLYRPLPKLGIWGGMELIPDFENKNPDSSGSLIDLMGFRLGGRYFASSKARLGVWTDISLGLGSRESFFFGAGQRNNFIFYSCGSGLRYFITNRLFIETAGSIKWQRFFDHQGHAIGYIEGDLDFGIGLSLFRKPPGESTY